MQLIQPSVEFYGAVPTDYVGTLAFIEKAGRICYKSESKGDPEAFVRKLIAFGHLAMVEHSNLVVKRNIGGVPKEMVDTVYKTIGKYLSCAIEGSWLFVGGSLTAWFYQGERISWQSGLFEPFRDVYGGLFGVPQTSLASACQGPAPATKSLKNSIGILPNLFAIGECLMNLSGIVHVVLPRNQHVM